MKKTTQNNFKGYPKSFLSLRIALLMNDLNLHFWPPMKLFYRIYSYLITRIILPFIQRLYGHVLRSKFIISFLCLGSSFGMNLC